MEMIRYFQVLLLVASLDTQATGASKTPAADITTADVAEIQIYAITPASRPIHMHFLRPHDIRAYPTVHFHYRAHDRHVIDEVLTWLNVAALHPYSLDEHKHVLRDDSGMVMVVDVQSTNGHLHSFYYDMDYLYDDSLTLRYRPSCSFLRRVIDMTSFGHITDRDRRDIERCMRHAGARGDDKAR